MRWLRRSDSTDSGPGTGRVLDWATAEVPQDPAAWHGWLAGNGPFDEIRDPSGDRDRFVAGFLHLVDGGTHTGPLPELGDGAHERSLAAAVAEVRPDVVVRRGSSVAKLREVEMNVALAVDPSRGRIVTSVPAARLESRCTQHASRARDGDLTRPAYDAPELFLREYHDAVVRMKGVVEQRGLLAPDTFRHHLAVRLTHRKLVGQGPLFAEAPPAPPKHELAGTYYHLDNEVRGFFGHALTEQVSRLWGWDHVRALAPDAKVLVTLNRGRPVAEWEYQLLEAGGVPRDDVVVLDGPARVERLLSATPMFSMPRYVHPAISEVWDRIGRSLLDRSSLTDTPRRVFCSRRHGKRECLNTPEVEAWFERLGFTVLHPEDHPLPDQVRLFHEADVVAGFSGSGMFTTMFTDRPKHLALVSPDTYGPTNEYMISAVRGHTLDVALGRTPSPLPEGLDPKRPLQWPFTVDLDEDGAWLRERLAAYGV